MTLWRRYEEPSLHGRQPARSGGSSEASQPASWTPTRGEKKNTSVLPSALERLRTKLPAAGRCQLEAAAGWPRRSSRSK